MTDHDARLSRRAVLAGCVGVALAGCTNHHAAPVADPDRARLQAARDVERLLLQSYAHDTDGHSIHLAHLRALGDTGPLPSPGLAPHGGGAPPERPTVQPLLDAARAARRGSTAALLASIAASHAVLSGVRVP